MKSNTQSPQATPAQPSEADATRLSCAIVMPVGGDQPKLAECVAAAADALTDSDELIVVTDGAINSSGLPAEVGARVIVLPSRSGPAHARNVGAQTARSDILFFVDADVMINRGTVERVRTAFEQEPDVAAFIGSYDDDPAAANFVSQYKNLFHHFVHQRGSSEASTFWGACGAIRREVFQKVGGFDETFDRPSIEDIELGYRLKAMSQRIRLLPDLQVKHLKRWERGSLIKTDMLDRAAPWTELIWNQIVHRKPSVTRDLNLGRSFQLSLLCSFLLVLASVSAFFTRWAVPLIFGFGAMFIALNLPFFRFFRSKRGRRFALQALGWRFGYDIYSGLGFFYGSLHFASDT